MKPHKIIYTLVSCVLILSLLISLSPPVFAEAGVQIITVECEEKQYDLELVKSNNVWFVGAEGLASLGGFSVSFNQEEKKVQLEKNEHSLVLYEAREGVYLEKNGKFFLPLKDASVKSGIKFYGTDPICCIVYRTPKEMIAEITRIMQEPRYQVSQIIAIDNYWVAESTAVLYSMMPCVGSSSLLGVVSGADKEERYRNAIAGILTKDGSTNELLSELADFDKDVKKNWKIIKAVMELTEKGGKVYQYLESAGVDTTILDYFAYEENPLKYYDSVAPEDFFESLSTVLSAVNFGYFLDMCAFYATAVDTEESILLAMKKVFENGKDKDLSNIVKKLLDNRFEGGPLGIMDIYNGVVWDYTMGFINDNAEQLLYGENKAITLIAANCIDSFFQASNKADAFLYFPIFASIQQELQSYYFVHKNDTEEYTMYDMRAAAIMYLKAAVAAYEYAEFDDSIADSIEYAMRTFNTELAYILSFSESEYAPDYTNQELIDWLNEKYPDSDEYNGYGLSVFDETYWSMCFGQSLGFNYSAKFSADGTFSARSMGSGAYKDGTYEFHDGYLTIYFDISGFGYESETEFYSSDGKEFKSVEKYGMQVGEDYYTIRALPEGDDFFDSGLEKEEPESVTPDPVPPEQSGGNNPAGEQWGAWSEWQDTPINADANTQVETRTVYGYYYFLCPNCGAHMHGYVTCYPWAGGCGGYIPESSWHQIWSEIPWDEANLQDWHGTGKYNTYIDGELVFKWDDNGQPKTQYRCRTKTSADAGLADGSYYVEIVFEEVLYEREYLTFDLLEVTGYAPSDNPIFEYAEESYVLEIADGCVIRDSSVFSDDGLTEIYYDDLGPILNQYGFGTIVSIKVLNGEIVYIDKFYMA